MSVRRPSRAFALVAAGSLLAALSLGAVSAAVAVDDTATPSPSAEASPSPSAGPVPAEGTTDPTAEASPSASDSASASASPSDSASPSASPSDSASPSPSATDLVPADETGAAITVTLCHATGDADAPFAAVTVAADTFATEGLSVHAHANDIIPAAGDFAGQNLAATYGNGLTGSDVLGNGCSVSVDRGNQGPTVVVEAVEVVANVGDRLEIVGSFADPDGDLLTITADNAIGTFTDNEDGTWRYRLATDADAPNGTVTVTATDPDGLTATDAFTYVINHKPVVVGYARSAQVNDGDTLSFFGFFEDPDGDPLVVVSTATIGTFSDNGDGSWSYVLQAGSATPDQTITVTATDSLGLGASDTFGYRVNRKPVVTSAASSVEVVRGETVSVSGSFADPDGGRLVLLADNELVTFTDNGNGSWTYVLQTDGFTPDGTVTVTARDSHGLTASDRFSYRVKP